MKLYFVINSAVSYFSRAGGGKIELVRPLTEIATIYMPINERGAVAQCAKHEHSRGSGGMPPPEIFEN